MENIPIPSMEKLSRVAKWIVLAEQGDMKASKRLADMVEDGEIPSAQEKMEAQDYIKSASTGIFFANVAPKMNISNLTAQLKKVVKVANGILAEFDTTSIEALFANVPNGAVWSNGSWSYDPNAGNATPAVKRGRKPGNKETGTSDTEGNTNGLFTVKFDGTIYPSAKNMCERLGIIVGDTSSAARKICQYANFTGKTVEFTGKVGGEVTFIGARSSNIIVNGVRGVNVQRKARVTK